MLNECTSSTADFEDLISRVHRASELDMVPYNTIILGPVSRPTICRMQINICSALPPRIPDVKPGALCHLNLVNEDDRHARQPAHVLCLARSTPGCVDGRRLGRTTDGHRVAILFAFGGRQRVALLGQR